MQIQVFFFLTYSRLINCSCDSTTGRPFGIFPAVWQYLFTLLSSSGSLFATTFFKLSNIFAFLLFLMKEWISCYIDQEKL